MAIYHLSVKTISRSRGGSAAAKADYVQRDGKYAKGRSELIDTFSGNMPEWASLRPADYWIAADRYERANGRLCTQVEFALPVELTKEQQTKLATEFARDLTRGENLPFTLAIHSGKGANPHCHLMISERVNDGLWRAPETWFRRHDARRPTIGGARKTEALKSTEWLEQTRERWAEIANKALDRDGHQARIDHRSLEAQGVERVPTVHLGPNVIAMERRLSIRSDRREIQRSVQEANTRIIDLAEARKRIEAEKEAARKAEEQKQEPITAPVYLKVDYSDKDRVKALGGKRDKEAKSWYAPAEMDTAPFSEWMPQKTSQASQEERPSPENPERERRGIQTERKEAEKQQGLEDLAQKGVADFHAQLELHELVESGAADFLEQFEVHQQLEVKREKELEDKAIRREAILKRQKEQRELELDDDGPDLGPSLGGGMGR